MLMIGQEVAAMYRAAGHDPAVPPGLGRLALGLFPRKRISYGPASGPAKVSVIEDGGAWALRLHPEIPSCELARALSSPLADWWCKTRNVSLELRAFAEELLVPTPALLIARGLLAEGTIEIGRMFFAPPDVVARRIREVFPPDQSGEYFAMAV